MEYQFFDTPQPSQPMAQLRIERLQQLREERMRRQQRRMKSDITTIIPWGGKVGRAPSDLAAPPYSPQRSASAPQIPAISPAPGEVSRSGKVPVAPEQDGQFGQSVAPLQPAGTPV